MAKRWRVGRIGIVNGKMGNGNDNGDFTYGHD